MKKNLLLGAFLFGSLLTAKAQTVLFSDGFETYDDFVVTTTTEVVGSKYTLYLNFQSCKILMVIL